MKGDGIGNSNWSVWVSTRMCTARPSSRVGRRGLRGIRATHATPRTSDAARRRGACGTAQRPGRGSRGS
eukprot:6194749-Pleurochrysis_carterae.AAC.1